MNFKILFTITCYRFYSINRILQFLYYKLCINELIYANFVLINEFQRFKINLKSRYIILIKLLKTFL